MTPPQAVDLRGRHPDSVGDVQVDRLLPPLGISLLLIEDNPGDADLVRELLRMASPTISVRVTERLAEGLRLLDDLSIDCVLVDLSLPDAQRLEALTALLAVEPAPPVVVLTGSRGNALGREAMVLGAQDFLLKGSFDADRLEVTVRHAVERHRRAAALVESQANLEREVSQRKSAEQDVRRSEEKYRRIVELANEGIWTLDADHRTSFVNQRMAHLLGAPVKNLLGVHWRDLVDQQYHSAVAARLARPAADDPSALEARLARREGDAVYVELVTTPLMDGRGAPAGALLMVSDVTERRAQAKATSEATELIRHAFTSALIGMALVELDGSLREVNESLQQMLSLPTDVALSARLQDFVEPDNRPELLASLASLAVPGQAPVTAELEMRGRDGQRRDVQLSMASVGGAFNAPYIVCQIEDVSRRTRAEQALLHSTLHDALTGLANRTLLGDRISQALQVRDRGDDAVAVLFLDLDRFKLVNDTYGHATGDHLLVEVGRRLTEVVRPEDTVSRFGGDEFVLLLTGLSCRRAALDIAERVLASVNAPFGIDRNEFRTAISIGVAFAAATDNSPEALLAKADAAMYSAKGVSAGYKVFSQEHTAQAEYSLRMESLLHNALRREELRLYYQPYVDLASGTLVGAEALMRIEHPDLGVLQPAAFLSVAETTGLIEPMGAWAIREASRMSAQWKRFGHGPSFPIAVNVSGRQLEMPGFADTVRAAVGDYGLTAGSLTIELTESVLMTTDAPSVDILAEIRSAGIQIALDDFGTGYSSMTYLRRFPIDVLKIDQQFIAGLGASSEDEAIVMAIISLATSLNLKVVAEGIETAAQLSALQGHGCHFGQGFLFGRPLPAEEFERLVRNWTTPSQPNS